MEQLLTLGEQIIVLCALKAQYLQLRRRSKVKYTVT